MPEVATQDWSGAKDRIREMLAELKTLEDIARELRPAPRAVVQRLMDEVLLEEAHQMESITNLDKLMQLKARHSLKLEAIADLSIQKYQQTCTTKRPGGRVALLSVAVRSLAEQRRIWGADAPQRLETRVVNETAEVDPGVQRELFSDPELQRLALERARREHEIRTERSNTGRLRSGGVWGQLELPPPPVPPDLPAD